MQNNLSEVNGISAIELTKSLLSNFVFRLFVLCGVGLVGEYFVWFYVQLLWSKYYNVARQPYLI